MTLPELIFIQSSSHHPLDDNHALVLLAQEENNTAKLVDPSNIYSDVAAQLKGLKATGKSEELHKLWSAELGIQIYVIGIGKEISVNTLREAAGSVSRRASGVTVLVYDFAPEDAEAQAAIAEGAGHGVYRFDKYRKPAEDQPIVKQLIIVGEHIDTEKNSDLYDSILITIAALKRTKDLVNTPAQDLYPENFADQVLETVEGLPIEATVWDEEGLERDGFGGILGVGQGSTRPPRLVKLHYKPEGAKKHLALIGKGITFDTGGLSLKPPAAMVGMKYDMTGAATVFSVIVAAAELGFNTEITAWLALAENMPSGTATRPNDVLTIKGGKTVEVTNTDAEGRLVLADALVAASEEHPDFLVDVATLTGAATIALGNRYTAVLGDDELSAQIIDTANEVGELLWQLPLDKNLRSILDSDIADIANAKPGSPAGGTIVGALFLKDFIGKDAQGEERIPWAHLDIAPTAQADKPYGFTTKGASAVTVRTLLKLASELN